MTITFIGTGSIIPDPKFPNAAFRSYSAIYVEAAGETFLFDVGPGTLTKLQQHGINTRIHPKHVCISHYHIDHCGDYPALIKGRWFDPKTGALVPYSHVNIYGPKDLTSWTQELFSGIKRWNYMSDMLDYKKVATLHEITSSDVAKTDRWMVTCCPVEHYDGVAFRLEAEGKSFVYSGDMVYDERLAQLGKNADVVAIECSFPSKKSLLGKHLCPEDVGRLARKGNFKHTVLTHLYPLCAGHEEEMKNIVESASDTHVTVAEDYFTVKL